MILEDFIVVYLGKKDSLDRDFTLDEWKALQKLFTKQSLLGVFASVIVKLSENPLNNIPIKTKATALLILTRISQSNQRIRLRSSELATLLRDSGYDYCFLKGLSYAINYPQPDIRQCGDIDVWVAGDWKDTYNSFGQHYPVDDLCYHHFDAKIFEDTKVEVHFFPSWMYSPLANARLQKYFKSHQSEQMNNFSQQLGYPVCQSVFGLVYSFIHLYRHILFDGIGLRQFMDLYYQILATSALDRQQAYRDLHKMRLDRLVSSTMWVLQKVFFLPEEYLLCAPDAHYGEFIYNEMCLSGNFGKYDRRYKGMAADPLIKRIVRRQGRLFRFFFFAPSEVLCAPIYKLFKAVVRRA